MRFCCLHIGVNSFSETCNVFIGKCFTQYNGKMFLAVQIDFCNHIDKILGNEKGTP